MLDNSDNTEKMTLTFTKGLLKGHVDGYIVYKREWLMNGDNLEMEINLLRSLKEWRDRQYDN